MHSMRRSLGLAVAAYLLFAGAAVPMLAQSCPQFGVLVFSKTAGFRHDPQIVAGALLIQTLGASNGFSVVHTEDATQFNAANLAQFAAVVFLNTTGDVLDATQQSAFEAYVNGGGGFVGIHSATDTEYGWPFYGALVGAYFAGHPAVQAATVSVANATHPSTVTLPSVFTHTDEWYNFQTNVATNPLFDVLLTIDENTYTGGTMGAVHPIAWAHEPAAGGRAWYTGLGHSVATYSAPFFHDHLRGGILWASGATRSATLCGVSTYGSASGPQPLTLAASPGSPPSGLITLSGGTAGAPGLLVASRCATSASFGSLTLLVDLSPGIYVTEAQVPFSSSGTISVVVPLVLPLPGSFGGAIFLQGAQLAPAISVSNGLQLALCF